MELYKQFVNKHGFRRIGRAICDLFFKFDCFAIHASIVRISFNYFLIEILTMNAIILLRDVFGETKIYIYICVTHVKYTSFNILIELFRRK